MKGRAVFQLRRVITGDGTFPAAWLGGLTLVGRPMIIEPTLICGLGANGLGSKAALGTELGEETNVVDPEIRRLPRDDVESKDDVDVRMASGSCGGNGLRLEVLLIGEVVRSPSLIGRVYALDEFRLHRELTGRGGRNSAGNGRGEYGAFEILSDGVMDFLIRGI